MSQASLGVRPLICRQHQAGVDLRAIPYPVARRESSLDIGAVLQASDSAVLENLGTLKVTSFNWNVDLAAGTSVVIQMQDSLGATATSKILTIQAGSTDCTLSTVGNQQTTTIFTRATTSIRATTSTRSTTSTLTTPIPPTASTAPPTSSTGATNPESATSIQSQTAQQSSSLSLVVVPPSTSAQGPPSASATSDPTAPNYAVGSYTRSDTDTGAYSTTSPEAVSALNSPDSAPIGVILGTLIPGLFLLLLVGVLLFRRRRRRASTAGIEELAYGEEPKWFMQPAYRPSPAPTEATRAVSYGFQSSGSYRTRPPSSLPSPSAASSDSVSRFERSSFAIPELSSNSGR
ncbi:hypothetical protein B0H17DRAFT_8074 [Mycena rosella]|uniref:Mid2 domain-containing protein n=1 Tax=Mycena rosella TaxID=1033263 RepID=A0AAD7M745_MYCRO|nr:hypothetical protein B0H17DRAFT_8074 [Mycena rosella]